MHNVRFRLKIQIFLSNNDSANVPAMTTQNIFLKHDCRMGMLCGSSLLKEANHHTFRTNLQEHWSIGMSMPRPS